MFSKRHYETIATLLQVDEPQDIQSAEHVLWEKIVTSFANYFAIDNPKFKKGVFTAKCCAPIDPWKKQLAELRKSH